MRPPLLALAAVLVGLAVAVAFGNLHPLALALVLAGVASAVVALALGESARPWPLLTAAVLGAGTATALALDLLLPPGWYAGHAQLPAFRALLLLSGALAATHLLPRAPAWLARLRFPSLVALWLVLVTLLFRAVPSPAIDVWDIQQGGAAALARGENPYAAGYPNRYGPGTRLLAPEVLSPDGLTILAYPYPPLTLLAGLASLPLGDVRWIHAALTALSAVGILRLGRRTRVSELAATFVLFQPRTFFVMEQSWTEPLVLATLVGLALSIRPGAVVRPSTGSGRTEPGSVRAGPVEACPEPRRRARIGFDRILLPGLLAGLALAAKQYVPLLLLPFLPSAPPRVRWRIVAVAVLVAAALYLPFLAWDPSALWRSLVGFHLAQPFRRDSLSLSAALLSWGGVQLPAWPGFAVAGAVVAVGWRAVQQPAGALALAALVWLALLLLAKQAFANYHWLAVGLLCAAVAADARSGDRGTVTRGMEAR